MTFKVKKVGKHIWAYNIVLESRKAEFPDISGGGRVECVMLSGRWDNDYVYEGASWV